MRHSLTLSISSYWVIYVLIMALLSIGVWRFAVEQFERDRASMEASAISEQESIGTMVRGLLRDGNYEDVQTLVSRWGDNHAAAVEIVVESGNGFELGRYDGGEPMARPLAVESVLDYRYGKSVRLRLVHDIDRAYRDRDSTLVRLSLVVILLGLFGAHLLRTAQRSIRSAESERALSERLALTNADLEESETRFRRLVEGLAGHFLLTHGDEDSISYVSPSVQPILGYTPLEFRTRFADYLTENPQNAAFRDCTRQCFQGGSPPPYELEIRAKSQDIRILEVRQAPVSDASGAVIVVETIAQDITERKTADAQQRVAASVFENSAEGIMVTDTNGVIQRINRAFTRITGYSVEESVGRNPRFLQSGRQGPEFYQAMWTSVLERGCWQGEVWNRHKDGKIYPEWLSISRIPANGGGQERYVGIIADISRQKEAEAEILRLAFNDALTGLPNRTLLMDRLETNLARAQRAGHIDALLFLDLDHFKHVNDSLGHSVGDGLLKEVAQRLRESVREYDTVARLGGDEFVVLVNAVAEDHHLAVRRVRRAAEKIRAAIVKPMMIAGHELHTSPSIGIALIPLDADNAEDALKYSDKAMYQAKAKGRNTIQFFTLEMQSEAEQRLALENELRRAIEQEELEVHYQPIVDFSNGCIAGLEALVRWQHPRHGLIAPGRFIPIAEESGLILPIGQWVLDAACRQLRSWQEDGLPPVFVAVNLSAVQFRQADITRHIAQSLRDSGLDPAYLELELTESLLVENVEMVIGILHELDAMGVRLSVDDFGTGYSSLSYLRRFRLHKLKIDRSFVEDLPDNADATAITTTIVQMAQNLGLKTVAEGVESIEQLAFLKDVGCDYAQGYLCSRPVPPDQVPDLLIRLNPEAVAVIDKASPQARP